MNRAGRVAVDQEQLYERHQTLFAERRERVLVANGEDIAATTILEARENDVGELLFTRFAEHDQLQQFRTGRVRTQLNANLLRILPVLPPGREPLLQQLGRDLGLNQ